MKYPCVQQKKELLIVEFGPELHEVKRRSLRMVVDLGSHGDVLGIEIINLILTVGKHALEVVTQVVPNAGTEIWYGYDEESDSFYLGLKSGDSRIQKSVDGSVICDEVGRIIALNANWQ